jgi:hypothetical protein
MESRLGSWRARWANPLALALLFGFFVVETTRRVVLSGRYDEHTLHDFLINLTFTWRTLETGFFPPDFYYPVPFIVFYDVLGSLGIHVGAFVWFALVVAGSLASCALLIRLAGWGEHPLRWPAAVLAVFASSYYVQWDLRTANSNLVYLALLLASFSQTNPSRAGALLALSVSLKLYSVLALPYLAWTRRWKWLGWSVAWLFVCFVLLPAIALGPGMAFDLTWQWFEKLLSLPGAASMPDFYRSLTQSLLALLNDESGGGENVASLGPGVVEALSVTWKLAWVAMIGLYFARAEPLRGPHAPSALLLLDVSAIALLPLPFSPTFQPHHAAVTLVPAFLLVMTGLDVEREWRERIIAVAFLFLAAGTTKLIPDWPQRGVAVMLSLAVSAGSLLWMVGELRAGPKEEPAPT